MHPLTRTKKLGFCERARTVELLLGNRTLAWKLSAHALCELVHACVLLQAPIDVKSRSRRGSRQVPVEGQAKFSSSLAWMDRVDDDRPSDPGRLLCHLYSMPGGAVPSVRKSGFGLRLPTTRRRLSCCSTWACRWRAAAWLSWYMLKRMRRDGFETARKRHRARSGYRQISKAQIQIQVARWKRGCSNRGRPRSFRL